MTRLGLFLLVAASLVSAGCQLHADPSMSAQKSRWQCSGHPPTCSLPGSRLRFDLPPGWVACSGRGDDLQIQDPVAGVSAFVFPRPIAPQNCRGISDEAIMRSVPNFTQAVVNRRVERARDDGVVVVQTAVESANLREPLRLCALIVERDQRCVQLVYTARASRYRRGLADFNRLVAQWGGLLGGSPICAGEQPGGPVATTKR